MNHQSSKVNFSRFLLFFLVVVTSNAVITESFLLSVRSGTRTTRNSKSNIYIGSTQQDLNDDVTTSTGKGNPTGNPTGNPPGNPTPISILYESDNILAIDKPPHIPHHDSDTEIGILSHIRMLQADDDDHHNNNNFTYKGRIYGCHRLDRVTSGILLLAKTQEAAASLSNSFRTKVNMTKYYIALSNKKPKKKKQGWVKGDMVPSRRGAWKLTSTKENPAVSRFYSAGLGNFDFKDFPLHCHSNSSLRETEDDGNDRNDGDVSLLLPKTLILFHPHTGKTHQLRVAAKSVGLPILGDKMYADAIDAQNYERTYLHALAMHVNVNGEDVAIWNPPDWFHLIGDDKNGNSAEGAMIKLLQKHCVNEFILDAVSQHESDGSLGR